MNYIHDLFFFGAGFIFGMNFVLWRVGVIPSESRVLTVMGMLATIGAFVTEKWR